MRHAMQELKRHFLHSYMRTSLCMSTESEGIGVVASP